MFVVSVFFRLYDCRLFCEFVKGVFINVGVGNPLCELFRDPFSFLIPHLLGNPRGFCSDANFL